jgi:hypothetical protein
MMSSNHPNELTGERQRRMRRERLLLAYQDALHGGDLAAQEAVIEQAAGDADFEEAVWGLHVLFGAEAEAADARASVVTAAADAARVQDLAASSLSASVAPTRAEAEALLRQQADAEALAEETELPPLLLRDVVARLRHDIARGLVAARDRAAALQGVERIEAAGGTQTLDDDLLTRRGARTRLARFGLAGAGAWFERLFHGAVLDLTMAREQDNFRLAAARRARHEQQRINTPHGTNNEKEAPE